MPRAVVTNAIRHSDKLDSRPRGSVRAKTKGKPHESEHDILVYARTWVPPVQRFSAAVYNQRYWTYFRQLGVERGAKVGDCYAGRGKASKHWRCRRVAAVLVGFGKVELDH